VKLASYPPSCAYKFELAPRILENFRTPDKSLCYFDNSRGCKLTADRRIDAEMPFPLDS